MFGNNMGFLGAGEIQQALTAELLGRDSNRFKTYLRFLGSTLRCAHCLMRRHCCCCCCCSIMNHNQGRHDMKRSRLNGSRTVIEQDGFGGCKWNHICV